MHARAPKIYEDLSHMRECECTRTSHGKRFAGNRSPFSSRASPARCCEPVQFKAPPRDAYLPPHKTPFEVTAHLALRFDGNKRYTSNAHDTFADPASYSCGGQSTHAEIRHIDANRPSEAHIDHPFFGAAQPTPHPDACRICKGGRRGACPHVGEPVPKAAAHRLPVSTRATSYGHCTPRPAFR